MKAQRRTELEQALAGLSRRQHGVWSRRQVLDLGFSATMVRDRLRTGVRIAQDTAVYAHAATEPTWHRSVMSALLAEPVAAASHRTAAVLHGLAGFRPGRPEITVPPGASARGALAVVHRNVDLRTTSVRRIPCATPVQTFVDLAQVCPEGRVRESLEAWLISHPRDLGAIRDRYVELAPRGGRDLRVLRRLIEDLGDDPAVSESVLEARLQRLLMAPGLPPVHWQAPFPGRVTGPQRVDGLIPEWSLIIEGDGRTWHARLADFERDRRRDAEAAAVGLQTLRFTWQQITVEPAWVLGVTIAAGRHRMAA